MTESREAATDAQREQWRERAEEREYTAMVKGALIYHHLRGGEGLRTCDAADLIGVSFWGNAARAMENLAAAFPFIERDEFGVWYINFENMPTV